MNPAEMLKASQETTRVIKRRQYSLFTFGMTRLPYYFIGRSEIDGHDTVTRRGRVMVEKPRIYVPGYNPLFEGFEFPEDIPVEEGDIKYILMARRIMLPSLKYTNQADDVVVEPKPIDDKVSELCNRLDREADTVTAVICGEDKFFPFPLIIYVGEMIQRSSGDNIMEYFEKRGGLGL